MTLWFLGDPTLSAAFIKGKNEQSEVMASRFHFAMEGVRETAAALREAASGVRAWAIRRRRAHAAIAVLRGLDDRLLSDIGIGRGEIAAAARHGFRSEDDYRSVAGPRSRGGDGHGRRRGRPEPDWRQAA